MRVPVALGPLHNLPSLVFLHFRYYKGLYNVVIFCFTSVFWMDNDGSLLFMCWLTIHIFTFFGRMFAEIIFLSFIGSFSLFNYCNPLYILHASLVSYVGVANIHSQSVGVFFPFFSFQQNVFQRAEVLSFDGVQFINYFSFDLCFVSYLKNVLPT